MERKKLIPLAMLTFVLVGSSAVALGNLKPSMAFAQSSDTTKTDATEKPDSNDQTPSYVSSVTIQESVNETDESGEAAALAPMAKITAEEAKSFAQDNVGGTATSAKLENENGNVVYEVKIGTKEVKVDAGNGKILNVESDEAEND